MAGLLKLLIQLDYILCTAHYDKSFGTSAFTRTGTLMKSHS